MRTAAHAANVATAIAVCVLAGLFYIDTRDERDDADRAACIQVAALEYRAPAAEKGQSMWWEGDATSAANERQARSEAIAAATARARADAAEDCMD